MFWRYNVTFFVTFYFKKPAPKREATEKVVALLKNTIFGNDKSLLKRKRAVKINFNGSFFRLHFLSGVFQWPQNGAGLFVVVNVS